jgi:hypothetical protein
MTDDDSEWDIETGSVAAEDEGADTESTDDEWRFSVSDLPDDEEEDEQSAVGGNVFGSLSSDTDIIEAGSPGRESTLFVAVGIVLALLFFFQFYLLMG